LNTNKKILIITLISLVSFTVVIFQLLKIQIFEHSKYEAISKKQTQLREYVAPLRGTIFDRNLKPLAVNYFYVSVNAIPKRIKNADSTATVLSYAFGKDKDYYLPVLKTDYNYEVPLEKDLKFENTSVIDEIKISGIIITKKPYRYYPFGTFASQIIGFINNNEGRSGIELSYDEELSGKCGMMIMQKDGNGNKRPFQGFRNQFSEPGKSIVLTIDINLQKILEEELQNGVSEFKARYGNALIISVKTGEILAMSSFPTFNPNNVKQSDTIGIKNRIITDQYDPGSTFKVITAAGILEQNLANIYTEINTENGLYKIAGRELKDEYPSPSMTFRKVIEKSSNIGVAKLSEMLGKDRLYRYIKNFGLGNYTGIEIAGEVKGIVKHPHQFEKGSLQFISIGYEVAVSPLQMTMVYGCIANKGILMKPFVLKKILNSKGEILSENTPVRIRRVVSEKTSIILTDVLKGVVDNSGTGSAAFIENIEVAGKTGTTQYNLKGKYVREIHNSSFIGYYPANNPTVLIAIFLEELTDEKFYGGLVAAPIFKNISKRLIDYVGYDRINSNDLFNEGTDLINNHMVQVVNAFDEIPYIEGTDVYNALKILRERKIKYEINGFTNIPDIPPKKYTVLKIENINTSDNIKKVRLYIKDITTSGKGNISKVPDVTGMSIRRAITKLTSEGYTVEVKGIGKVLEQEPSAGTELKKSGKVKIICKRKVL